MQRKTLLAGASAAALLLAAPAGAISVGTPVGPLVVDVDGESVVVQAAGSVVSDDADSPAIAVEADDVSIENDGLIAQTDDGGYAVTTTGRRTAIVNRGAIASGDRGIEALDEVEDANGDDAPTGADDLTVTNAEGATITSRRQAVRSPVPGATLENDGTIVAAEGRTVQFRGDGATVVNGETGVLNGGEEAVEARGDFTLENRGRIFIGLRVENAEGDLELPSIPEDPTDPTAPTDPGAFRPDDEDGVQFASGTVDNWGLIQGTDDGIDVDEGLIRNHEGGRIVSLGGGNGIDVDEIYEDEDGSRDNLTLRVENAGLIEGPQALGVADGAKNRIEIVNSGVLRGTSGVAVKLDPMQAASSVTLTGESMVFGDIVFGGADDVLTIEDITSGSLINSEFDGGGGMNTVVLEGYDLSHVVGFGPRPGGLVTLNLLSNGDLLTGPFRNFQTWVVGGRSFDVASLTAATPAPIPLPGALPLLLGAFGGLAALRRRR